MKKVWKPLIYSLGVFVALFIGFSIWYYVTYSMGKANSFAIANKENQKSALIVYQGSAYKNVLAEVLKDSLLSKEYDVLGRDVEVLDELDSEGYDVIIIIHTWEMWKPPKVVSRFLASKRYNPAKTVIHVTSGDGNYMHDGIDGISGESEIENIPNVVKQIMDRVVGVN